MHRRRPPAREQQSVAVARPPADAHGFNASRPDDAFDGGAVRYAQRGCEAGSARIDNFDLRASLSQGLGHGIGAVVVGRDDHTLADQHAEALEIDERRVGGHHAWPVVVGNDERPLDRAGCDHDPLRANAPERVGRRRAALPGANEVAVVDAVSRRARHHPPAGGFDGAHDALRPVAPIAALDRAAAMDKLAADLGMVVNEKHCASRAGARRSPRPDPPDRRRQRADRSAR